MSKKIYNFTFLFHILLLIHLSYSNPNPSYQEQSQILIYKGLLGNPYDDDSEQETSDRNCNDTEYPEQAIKCQNETMICRDISYLHHCSCIEGYITVPYPSDTYKYCNFKQKKQLIAFLLELCIGFGIGHFYRYDFIMASFKFLCFGLGIAFICLFPKMAKYIADQHCDILAILMSIFYYFYICGLAFWYIWDLVYFGNNYYKDYTYKSEIGKGIDLEPW